MSCPSATGQALPWISTSHHIPVIRDTSRQITTTSLKTSLEWWELDSYWQLSLFQLGESHWITIVWYVSCPAFIGKVPDSPERFAKLSIFFLDSLIVNLLLTPQWTILTSWKTCFNSRWPQKSTANGHKKEGSVVIIWLNQPVILMGSPVKIDSRRLIFNDLILIS